MHWLIALILAAAVVWGLSRLDKQMASRMDPGNHPRPAPDPVPVPKAVPAPEPVATPAAPDDPPPAAADIEDELPTILADGLPDIGKAFETRASPPEPEPEPEPQLATIDPALPPMEKLSAALQAGVAPDADLVGRLARNPLTRREAYLRLKTAKKASAMPAKLRSRPAMAEADLAVWLAGSDFGPPDEIEQVESFTLETEADGKTDWYLLKFRAGDGDWMAGVSGGWKRSDGPAGVPSGDTGGYLAPWDDGKEAHAAGVGGLMTPAKPKAKAKAKPKAKAKAKPKARPKTAKAKPKASKTKAKKT